MSALDCIPPHARHPPPHPEDAMTETTKPARIEEIKRTICKCGERACGELTDALIDEAFALGAASRASPEAPPKLHEVPPMHGFPGHDCATMPCYVETLREYAKITAPYRREIDRLRGKVAGRASPEEGRARADYRCIGHDQQGRRCRLQYEHADPCRFTDEATLPGLCRECREWIPPVSVSGECAATASPALAGGSCDRFSPFGSPPAPPTEDEGARRVKLPICPDCRGCTVQSHDHDHCRACTCDPASSKEGGR